MDTILYFGAEWCSPCKVLKQVLQEVRGDFEDLQVNYYDIEKFPMLSKQYNIRSVPTLIKVTEKLEVIDTKCGIQTKQQLMEWIKDD